eukprot:TRINITY_DN1239_c0_g2_i1.p1 TRINITY_DN1239_c0_g2~~TRINITY_DN1239_c0_g2_i1.p1  ORF type:complete len:428 (-),score=94.91 TRINITY_DN1239_c0_g2_i1:1073-2287(-)
MFYSTRTLFTPANRALFNSSKQTNFHLVHATQVQARALTQTRPTVPTVEFTSLTPKELVEMIDKYVVGQDEAKLAVASALRNRWRRSKLTESQRKEIMPKNILMTGPTGVGKTEIARRVAKLCNAPFVRVEATRYTEVGFKGADVETMIVDLVEAAIRTVRERHMEFHAAASKANVEQLILTALLGPPLPEERGTRESLLEFLRRGDLDDIMVPYQNKKGPDLFNDFFGIQQQSPKKSKVAVRDIRTIEENLELKRLMDEGEIVRQALYEVEEYGIVFIDELDKVSGSFIFFFFFFLGLFRHLFLVYFRYLFLGYFRFPTPFFLGAGGSIFIFKTHFSDAAFFLLFLAPPFFISDFHLDCENVSPFGLSHEYTSNEYTWIHVMCPLRFNHVTEHKHFNSAWCKK